MVFGGVEKVRQIQRQGQKKRILDVCSFQLYFSFVAIILDHVLGLTAIDTGYGMEYGYLFCYTDYLYLFLRFQCPLEDCMIRTSPELGS